MKVNAYVLVFGIIGVIIVAAGLSVLFSNQGSTQSTLPNYGPAQDFRGATGWVNSPPLNLSELRGKVVLVDFWTYSCINCIRTIPYLNSWYSRYGQNGLVIVGVHTPEFQFEKNYSNVESAVKGFGIRYPVALDNSYSIWNAYNNHYWPADYLIDKNGNIRDTHIGEGGYNATEILIQELLLNAGYRVSSGLSAGSVNATSVNFLQIQTPEIYLGYSTARFPIGNAQGFSPNQIADYTISGQLQNSTAYFSGNWYATSDGMIAAGNNSEVFLTYDAKNVNIVAQGNSSMIIIHLDGMNLIVSYFGSDVVLHNGVALADISGARLYNVVAGQSYGWHTLEITANPGFKIYTFTFG